MSTPQPIYKNDGAGVEIYETDIQLQFVCTKVIDDMYAKYFARQDIGGKRDEKDGKIIWTFDKANPNAIAVISQVIREDITQKYRPKSLPPVGIPQAGQQPVVGRPPTPTPTPAPQLGPLPTPQSGGGVTADMLRAAAAPPPQQFGGGFSGGGGDAEKYILKKIWSSGDVVIVDYSKYSVALFGPVDWTKQNKEVFMQNDALFNYNLRGDPEGKTKMPGYTFMKSSQKAAEFLKQLTGADIMALASPPPERKGWGGGGAGRGGGSWGGGAGRGGGWGGGGSGQVVPAGPGAPPPPPSTPLWGAGPLPGMPPSASGMLVGLTPPIGSGIVGAVPVKPLSPKAPANPVGLLNEVINLLQTPLDKVEKVEEKKLEDPSSSNIRVGFYGPSRDVEAAYNSYVAIYPANKFATGKLAEIKIGTNTALIIDRTPASSD